MQDEIALWYTKVMVTLVIYGQVFASCLSYCPEDCKYLPGYMLCLITHYPVFQYFHLILYSEGRFLLHDSVFFSYFFKIVT